LRNNERMAIGMLDRIADKAALAANYPDKLRCDVNRPSFRTDKCRSKQ
jgi:hypothetical protein